MQQVTSNWKEAENQELNSTTSPPRPLAAPPVYSNTVLECQIRTSKVAVLADEARIPKRLVEEKRTPERWEVQLQPGFLSAALLQALPGSDAATMTDVSACQFVRCGTNLMRKRWLLFIGACQDRHLKQVLKTAAPPLP